MESIFVTKQDIFNKTSWQFVGETGDVFKETISSHVCDRKKQLCKNVYLSQHKNKSLRGSMKQFSAIYMS